ncbi:MAG: cytochrome c peroxidase [Acidobacteriota bacterium]
MGQPDSAGRRAEAPTGLEASDAAFPNKIALAWQHVRDGQVYRVFRNTTNDASSAISLGVTESLVFNDTTGRGETFFYWVRAEGSSGISSLSAVDQGSSSLGLSVFVPPPELGLLIAVPQVVPPSANPITGAKIYLGKTLFWDEQLSSTRTTACGTCHIFRAGGADPRSAKDVAASTHPGLDGVFGTADDVSGSRGVPLTRADGSYQWSPQFGLKEQVTPRRASSVLDAAFATVGVLWDGKPGFKLDDPISGKTMLSVSAALEAQVLLPLLNPVEMGHDGRTIADIITRVSESRPLALAPSIPPSLARWIGTRAYSDLFTEAFGTSEISAVRIAMAIASYERTLVADRTAIDGSAGISSSFGAGLNVFNKGLCSGCHRTPLTSDGQFHVTGVRPIAEDEGRGKVTGTPQDQASFRTPSLRNAALRGGLQHTGRFTSLEEVVEFYNRGGDFTTAPGFINGLVRPQNFTAQEKADLAKFLRTQMLDPRVVRESAPLFDRPQLYSESARVPVLVGSATLGPGGAVPQAIAIEPPFVGNPRFTVALSNVQPGDQAVLIVDRNDPGAGPAIPATASFARRDTITSNDGQGHGFASISLAIPNDPALAGTKLFGRWFVTRAGQVNVSQAFRFTIFAGAPEAEEFSMLSAASLTKGMVAPESLVSGFGSGLGGTTRLTITDRTGATANASISFVSTGQINFLIPAGVADGEATVRVLRGEVEVARGKLQIALSTPAFFSANSDGRDAAAALVQRIPASGPTTTSGLIRFDTDLQRWVPQPINLGPDTDQVFLLLFGTGIRGREGSVTATVGGTPVEVLFAGAQGQFEGLDQVNLRLPPSLAGRGELDVIVTMGDRRANVVRIAIQ